MTLEAVVFDLFGTLVEEFTVGTWDRCFDVMAGALGVPVSDFRRQWEANAGERQTGKLGDIEANVRFVREQLGVEPGQDSVERALEVRAQLYREGFVARPGALETLVRLNDLHYPVGLVSMCAPDTPDLWRSSLMAAYVDAEVFSSETGLRKSEPALYLLVCERLGVEPSVCLYVGDGSYGELTGAAAVGMHPVLILDPDEPDGEIHRFEAERWHGPAITSLAEVVGVLTGE